MFDFVYNSIRHKRDIIVHEQSVKQENGGIKMRPGETMCYYRARGGQKSVYVTIVYENDTLRESIIQRHEENHQMMVKEDYDLACQSTVLV